MNDGEPNVHGSEDQVFPGEARVRVLGVGGLGGKAVRPLQEAELGAAGFVILDTDQAALDPSSPAHAYMLSVPRRRGLGFEIDPAVARSSAEADFGRLRALCAGADVTFVVAGLGGSVGTGVSSVVARAAKEAGSAVLGFVTLPFECEGSRRQAQALEGLQHLKEHADGVLCLRNQQILKLIGQQTSMSETFQLSSELLVQSMRNLWRLLSRPGFINVSFQDVCAALQRRHTENAFASVEASGENRVREALDALMASPLLEAGQTLAHADAILVSLTGSADLRMTEVDWIMERLRRHCGRAHVVMGTAVEASFQDRLCLSVIASRAVGSATATVSAPPTTYLAPARIPLAEPLRDEAESGSLSSCKPRAAARLPSRFAAPPPELPPAQAEKLFAEQRPASARVRRARERLRQDVLPLEIVSRGRFESSEPTVYEGEDLDVPTYIRRGVPLN
jgi:cell division protein FtsZ